MSKLKSRWAKLRPALLVILGLTGVGVPLATAIVTASDVVVDVIDDKQEQDNAGD